MKSTEELIKIVSNREIDVLERADAVFQLGLNATKSDGEALAFLIALHRSVPHEFQVRLGLVSGLAEAAVSCPQAREVLKEYVNDPSPSIRHRIIRKMDALLNPQSCHRSLINS